jgi:hypothetical protein
MKVRKIAIFVVLIALFIAWYAFRPERLYLNRQVNEAFPAAKGGADAQNLESGTFYGIMHPTAGRATIYQMGD